MLGARGNAQDVTPCGTKSEFPFARVEEYLRVRGGLGKEHTPFAYSLSIPTILQYWRTIVRAADG